MRHAHLSLVLAGFAALSACGGTAIITPYRMDIQQGNYVSQEMMSQLKIGMTKEQVRYVLGTPLVSDIFHGDRWDYVYYKDPRRGTREGRKIAVVFENGKLARVLGDVVPAEPSTQSAPSAQQAPGPQPAAQPVAPQLAPEPAQPAGEPPKPTDEAAKPTAEAAKEKTETAQPEQQPERGFFGRLMEKLGL